MTENNKIPFLVYVVFHPESKDARSLAVSIHKMLNSDPVIPGLRIPALFAEEDGTKLPPARITVFDRAVQVFIIVLADAYLKVGYTGIIPDGRKNWGAWTADLYDQCTQHPGRRFIPFQLTSNAFPLHPRLNNINYPRAFAEKEDERQTWIERRIVIELVRFFQGEQVVDESGPQVSLSVFISHTKLDIDKEPKVIEQLTEYLNMKQPVKTWFDSGDIPGGSKFEEEIEKGIINSALLCVLTNSYGSREWCRKEILLAKKHMRPFVVIDALTSIEVRHFPYIGNAPVLRWNNDPDAAMHLLFKETLRQLHTEILLEKYSNPDDIMLPCTPELALIIGNKGKTYLYPDPPLGQEEIRLIEKAEVIVETPIQRFARNRPLAGMNIGLSLGDSTDQEKFGFNKIHLDQAAIEISRYLLLAGAILCYGGHPRKDGYTIDLFELIRSYLKPGIDPVHKIKYYSGWPLPLTMNFRADYTEMADFIRIPRPQDISENDDPSCTAEIETFFPSDSPIRRYAWARGMTEMRKQQTDGIHARVVMGGRIGRAGAVPAEGGRSDVWYNGRIPGILEEVYFSMNKDQPVFLVGGFGGCTRMVADVIRNIQREEMSWEFQKNAPHSDGMKELYTSRGQEWVSYEDMTAFLQKRGIRGLNNTLSDDENRELFDSINPVRIIELLLKGLINGTG